MKVYHKAYGDPSCNNMTIELSHEDRLKSRLIVRLPDGTEAKLITPRSEIIEHGSLFYDEYGDTVTVNGMKERLMRVTSDNTVNMLQAAYALGNRHVLLEIHSNTLTFLPDPVIEKLVKNFMLKVREVYEPFSPERGLNPHK
jgi:urease accessory protein